MLLHVFRHGIAIDRDDPACPPEAERFLTERGVKRTHLAARGMRVIGVRPDVIFTSPYRRAVQTAEIAAEALRCPAELIVTDELLPGADPRGLLALLAGRSESSVLAAGHAPHVDALVAAALDVPAFTMLRKAGAACVELGGSPRLLWLLEPRQLRTLARA
ncbi:MAG TPA: histidine phosphatase family protein [bacterium]|nr:histidine phosphatase family protein [bacterium]